MSKLLAVLLLALTACASPPQSPAQAVYATQGTYAVALTLAVKYKALPACVPTGPPLCKDAKIVADLQKADDVAYDALSAAQRVVRSPGIGANVQTLLVAADAAVGAFSSIANRLKVQP